MDCSFGRGALDWPPDLFDPHCIAAFPNQSLSDGLQRLPNKIYSAAFIFSQIWQGKGRLGLMIDLLISVVAPIKAGQSLPLMKYFSDLARMMLLEVASWSFDPHCSPPGPVLPNTQSKCDGQFCSLQCFLDLLIFIAVFAAFSNQSLMACSLAPALVNQFCSIAVFFSSDLARMML